MINVHLRKATGADLPHLVSWLNDPDICRYLTENLRRGDVTEMLLGAGLRRRDQAWYLFFEEVSEVPLGLVALDTIEADDCHANLWFLLGAQDRAGKGLTSMAIKKFCDENPENIHSVTAWAVSLNTASVRCMVRAGFQRVGIIQDAVWIDGWHDRVVMQRLIGPAQQ